MGLLQQLDDELKQAMRQKDETGKRVIRAVKAAVLNRKIEKGAELDDAEVLGVIQKQVKQRQDSLAAVPADKREQYAAFVKEQEDEIAWLERYLPKQLSDAELTAIVQEALAAKGIAQKSQMGQAMGAVMPLVKGRADGRRVQEAVQAQLH